MGKSIFVLSVFLLALASCADQPGTTDRINTFNDKRAPTYSTNGSYDDNGIEPPPNNGNQNFGLKGW